jgi:hypothetical protein
MLALGGLVLAGCIPIDSAGVMVVKNQSDIPLWAIIDRNRGDGAIGFAEYIKPGRTATLPNSPCGPNTLIFEKRDRTHFKIVRLRLCPGHRIAIDSRERVSRLDD